MNEKKQFTVDPDRKWLYRAGGIAAFILVTGWFLTIPLYAYAGGVVPHGAEAKLIHYASHEAVWWAILGLMVVTDFFYLGIAIALYQALKKVDPNMVMIFIAFKGLFVFLDLAVLWPNQAALFILSKSYTTAVTAAQRALIVNSAASPSAVLDSILPAIYSILIPSLGTLFASLVMFKGVFSKRTGYLGLAVAVTGLIALTDPLLGALGKIHIVNALLATVWFLMVGWRLYELGKS